MAIDVNNLSNDITAALPILIRIVLAVICGASIGFERMVRQKEAGIRTHIIVALGAAIMMIVSKYGFFDVVHIDGVSCDASRIAANIVTGVSFLGSGMIIFKGTIKGLTTAAGIWATSGIGMAIGGGMYFTGIISTVLLLLIQILIHKLLPIENTTFFDLKIKIKDQPQSFENITNILKENKCDIVNCNVEKIDGTLDCTFNMRSKKSFGFDKMQDIFTSCDYILSFSI